MASTNTDIWKISPEERAKHNAQFNTLNPINGFVSGEQAKSFFLQSGLPAPILGQIWGLADLNKDGKLDKKEFSIACFLIKKMLLGTPLPINLPPSILVEPTQAVIDLKAGQSLSSTNLLSQSLFQPTPTAAATASIPNLFPSTGFPSLQPLLSSSASPSAALLTQQFGGATVTTGFASLPNMMPVASPPTAAATPANTIPPIPTTSRNKYLQVFQSNDHTSSGFLAGAQSKTLLMQTGLPHQQLAQIWQLSDFDNDGKLSLEEFILAMHLCDYAKTGNVLPTVLPVDLQPRKSRASSFNTVSPMSALDSLMPISAAPTMSPTSAASAAAAQAAAEAAILRSFEDKRKENFDKGNAVLEAKRAQLREQAEREKREREEKERLEQEKKLRLKEDQERKRLAEIERQLEKQRMIDAQREEERKKALEQRESARNELMRQQRIEWERQRKTELENQRLKLQEQMSTLKAKDKNLEYDTQLLNDKIASSKSKISDTQSTLSELNIQMDSIKKNLEKKTNEFEIVEKYVKELNESLRKFAQEKLYLNEKVKNMNQDNPFAESYRNESGQYKQELMYIHQLKEESEKYDSDVNAMRTQIEVLKHTVEATKNEIHELNKENDRINSLVNLKRNDFKLKYPSNGLNSQINQALAFSASAASSTASTPSAITTPTGTVAAIASQFRSNTPKDNYDVFKEEISKIQTTTTTTSTSNLTNSNTAAAVSFNNTPVTSNPASAITSPVNAVTSPTAWASAASFDDPFNNNAQQATFDPFSNTAAADPFKPFDSDPFTSVTAASDSTDPWGAFGGNAEAAVAALTTAATASNGNAFDDAFDAFNDADAFKQAANGNSSNKNTFADANSNNWAAFDDAFTATKPSTTPNKVVKSVSNNSIKSNESSKSNVTSPTQAASVKNIVDKFNTQKVAIANGAPASVGGRLTNLPANQANLIKYRVLYAFEAQREDELSLLEGEIVAVDPTAKADEGWSYGYSKGRAGVFPTAFGVPLSELQAIQEEHYVASNGIAAAAPVAHNGNGFAHNPMPAVETSLQVITIAPYSGKKENHLSFNTGEVIAVREQQGAWWSGELNGKIGWFPQSYVKPLDKSTNGNHVNDLPRGNDIKNYFISMYAFESGEPGDLNFGQYEMINVVEINGEWYTGQIDDFTHGTQINGIFPSNYVRKFDFPIEYIQKFNIALATQDHMPQSNEELLLRINDLVAITQLSPDNQWSYGEVVDEVSHQVKRGWFPTVNIETIIVSTNNSATTAAFTSHTTTINTANTNSTTSAPAITTSSSNTNIHAFNNDITQTTIVSNQAEEIVGPTSPVNKSAYIDQVVALYDFQATTADSLSFPKDAIINILSKNGDWWTGEYNGKRGILPFNYVQSIDPQLYRDSYSNIEDSASFDDSDLYENVENILIDETAVSNNKGERMQNPEKQKMRSNIIKEILQTEVNYIQNLNRIVELYYMPLKQRKALSEAELSSVFVNINQIIEINTRFQDALLNRIEDNKRQKKPNVVIGDILLEHLPKMKVYSRFVSAQRYSEQTIIERMRTTPDFVDVVSKAVVNGDSGDFILKKLLLLPMQRITQYSLLIDKLLKYVPQTDEDYPKLLKASSESVAIIKKINDDVGKKNDVERLEWLEDYIANARNIGLRFLSETNFMGERKLLYHGPLIKESGKELFAFLFNDMLLIIEASQSSWEEIFRGKNKVYNMYKSPILLDVVRSVNSRMGQPVNSDSSFHIFTDREFIFRTSNPTLKNEWVKQIQKAVQEYKEKKNSLIHTLNPALVQKPAVARLLLVVMEAQDLYYDPTDDEKSYRNAFCEVKLGPQKFNTHTIESSLNPKWNTSMQFQIYDLNKDQLTFTVLDQKIYSPNLLLGKARISATSIYQEQKKENNPVIKVYRLSDGKSGKIMIKMSISLYQ